MAAVRRSLKRDLDVDFGDVVYLSDVMQPRHEFLTANHETPYVLTVFDLAAGPMVLDVPAASDKAMLFGSAIDSWEVPLVDIGATGDDAGKGGRYLFLPPRLRRRGAVGLHRGAVADPVRAHRAATDRPRRRAPRPTRSRTANSCGPIRSPMPTIRPRAGTSMPSRTSGRRCRRSISTTCALLAEVVEEEPPQDNDAVMLGALASIGIAKGVAFDPDAERAELLADGVREGAALMNDYFMNDAFVPHWPEQPVAGDQPRRQLRVLVPRRRQARLRPARRWVHVLGDVGTQAAR